MRKLLILFISIIVNPCLAQTSYMVGDGVAVFYPADFDSSATLPSMVFLSDLEIKGEVARDWKITPEFSEVGGKAVVKIANADNADLYGNGEVTGPLRRNNSEVVLWNTDNYGYYKGEGKRLYQSHPWVMGVRKDGSSFGIIADNTWKQQFVLNNDITISSEGPTFRIVVIEKSTPQEVLIALADLTGKMKLPPLWSLGYQQSRHTYYPDTRVKEIADELRTRKIPCDVIWMDIDYMDGYRIFTFDEEGFADPEALNVYLHELNFKTVYMIDPGIKKDSGYFVYDQGTAGDHWVLTESGEPFVGEVWPGDCTFPDFTRPETRDWWGSLYQDFMDYGIDGIWNDMNEPAVFDNPEGTMPEDNIHRGGGELPGDIHLRYHNVYGMLMVKASREGILKANPEKRPFILSRANFLGGQRYAATWTGDNQSTFEHLKLSIPMSLTLSLSGQPFNGPDVGGFVGDADGELLANWMAVGAYFPFFRNHASKGTVNQEPWVFGEEVEKVSRTAVNRRYRLLPYIYTLFREASINGLPVMRPVFFTNPADTTLRSEQQAFLIGDDLLITPRWAENVNYPDGDWDRIKFEEEGDEYQPVVRLRSGAIVPMGQVIQSTAAYSSDSITLLVNPDANGFARGTLYHDEGDGFGFENGDYAIHQFESSLTGSRLNVAISKIEGDREVKRRYRIGLVVNNEVYYSDWSSKDQLFMDYVVDRNPELVE